MEMLFDVMHIMRECLTKMCLLIYTSSEIAKYIWCFSTHVGLLKILRSFPCLTFTLDTEISPETQLYRKTLSKRVRQFETANYQVKWPIVLGCVRPWSLDTCFGLLLFSRWFAS